jgi:hypothetical protein
VHGRVLTTENLKRHRIQDPSRCLLCCVEEDTFKHLFLECEFTKQVWFLAFAELGRNIKIPRQRCFDHCINNTKELS